MLLALSPFELMLFGGLMLAAMLIGFLVKLVFQSLDRSPKPGSHPAYQRGGGKLIASCCYCAKRASVSDKSGGKMINCPSCKKSYQVPPIAVYEQIDQFCAEVPALVKSQMRPLYWFLAVIGASIITFLLGIFLLAETKPMMITAMAIGLVLFLGSLGCLAVALARGMSIKKEITEFKNSIKTNVDDKNTSAFVVKSLDAIVRQQSQGMMKAGK